MRLIDADALVNQCKEYSELLKFDGSTDREWATVKRIIHILNDAPTIEPEPCEDAVSRQAILNYKCDCYDSEGHLLYAVPTGYIVRMPSVRPKRKKGKWKLLSIMHSTPPTYVYRCSECGMETFGTHDFCPNCGAEMREPEDIPMEYFESGGR